MSTVSAWSTKLKESAVYRRSYTGEDKDAIAQLGAVGRRLRSRTSLNIFVSVCVW